MTYANRICYQCGGVNAGFEITQVPNEYACTCLDDHPPATAKKPRFTPDFSGTVVRAYPTARVNELLDRLHIDRGDYELLKAHFFAEFKKRNEQI